MKLLHDEVHWTLLQFVQMNYSNDDSSKKRVNQWKYEDEGHFFRNGRYQSALFVQAFVVLVIIRSSEQFNEQIV
jgi:hypothetical protein